MSAWLHGPSYCILKVTRWQHARPSRAPAGARPEQNLDHLEIATRHQQLLQTLQLCHIHRRVSREREMRVSRLAGHLVATDCPLTRSDWKISSPPGEPKLSSSLKQAHEDSEHLSIKQWFASTTLTQQRPFRTPSAEDYTRCVHERQDTFYDPEHQVYNVALCEQSALSDVPADPGISLIVKQTFEVN